MPAPAASAASDLRYDCSCEGGICMRQSQWNPDRQGGASDGGGSLTVAVPFAHAPTSTTTFTLAVLLSLAGCRTDLWDGPLAGGEGMAGIRDASGGGSELPATPMDLSLPPDGLSWSPDDLS